MEEKFDESLMVILRPAFIIGVVLRDFLPLGVVVEELLHINLTGLWKAFDISEEMTTTTLEVRTKMFRDCHVWDSIDLLKIGSIIEGFARLRAHGKLNVNRKIKAHFVCC